MANKKSVTKEPRKDSSEPGRTATVEDAKLKQEAKPKGWRSWFAKKPKQDQPAADGMRETVESIVVAFVLAFLFRTFEAEAFVIPTGSMAPTLAGRHKDVVCDKCGYPFRVNASQEVDPVDGYRILRPGTNLPARWVQACQCPICRHVMKLGTPLDVLEDAYARLDDNGDRVISQADFRNYQPDAQFFVDDVNKDGSVDWAEFIDARKVETEPSYKGDRILVGKFPYTIEDPERFDVVVFKYPGGAQQNYIKRLVGLPGETLRVSNGDLYVKRPGDDKFTIARKSSREKLRAVLQIVYDNDFVLSNMQMPGWPARWQPYPASLDEMSAKGWPLQFPPGSIPAVPDGWQAIDDGKAFTVKGQESKDVWLRYEHTVPHPDDWKLIEQGGQPTPHRLWIEDFNAYNQAAINDDVVPQAPSNVVGDLALQCELDIEGSPGVAVFELLEGGVSFRCEIDVADGTAKLTCPSLPDFVRTGDCGVKGPGKYQLTLGNVDDELFLWVGDRVVPFDGPTQYDSRLLNNFAPRDADLAPVGIASRGANLTVRGLKIWRDIFYIADAGGADMRPDIYNEGVKLADNQFFVMGDNSAESADSRYWGPVDRELLIGKALYVYWPHSFDKITGTNIWFPFFPNFGRMGFVR